jgi:hypothetical protein
MKKLISYGSITFALAMLFAMTASAGPAPNPPVVNLGTAGNFVILSESGITITTPSDDITGNIGTWAITGAAIHVTCPEVTGIIFEVDAAGPPCAVTAPSLLSTAVGDMGTAYTDAAGRAPSSAATTNVGAGTLTNLTLTRGVYQWGSAVTIPTDLTLNGGANDVWIFQVNGTLDMAANMSVILTGGAQAKNVFWQVTGAVTLGVGSSFEGTILAQTNIAMQTDATLNGRALAQTAVTLDANTVTIPAFAPPKGQKPIKVSINHVVQGDIGTCNNVWAMDTFDKKYTITAEFGAYNVNVVYTGGKFVTLAGMSPGACEVNPVPPGNGNTVAAGIKGDMKQEYNGTVIGTLIPGAKCTPSTCFDTNSILNTLFNPGWSWVILPDGGHWTWSNTYKAGKHGTWFDTSTNWPTNDTGDIQ